MKGASLRGQIIIIFLFFSCFAYANDADITKMKSNIINKLANPEMTALAIATGSERAVLCSQCHGEDGNSIKPAVPNLAAQNSLYLLDQIEKFADGRRKNFVMNALSKNFTADDKENLAIYYAKMVVNVTRVNPQLASKGRVLYVKQCITCHGEKGFGQAEFARLAGQKIEYVESTLKIFRDNSVNNNLATNRKSVIMDMVAQKLSDDDIRSLAAYVAQLE